MLNITLTVTAAPELLAAISSFTNAFTGAKMVSLSQANTDLTTSNISKEQAAASNTYNKTEPHTTESKAQVPSVQQTISTQQQAPVQNTPVQVNTVPTLAQTYTMEQLAVAATQIVDAGRREELVNLLNTYGVQALTALPKEQYGAFATQLRALGAKIDNLCVQKGNTGGSKI